jgi:hypothetical protein
MVNHDGTINVELLMGKARVAPLKKVTIPRMELAAATIAVKFGHLILQEMDYKFDDTLYWTDSMAVIRYIHNTSSRFHTFVANRLTTIHEGSVPDQWHYVPTEYNPADLATRGLSLKNKTATKMWLKGPEYLQGDDSTWPRIEISKSTPEDDPELRKVSAATVVHDTPVDKLFSHFSSWNKLKRIVAWILRAKDYLISRIKGEVQKGSRDPKPKCLTLMELRKSEDAIVKYEQEKYFGVDPRNNKASLQKLDPFKDDVGLVRVGGRLARSRSLPTESKHPILLPRESVITKLIIGNIHRSLGHSGRNAMLTELRKKYWVPRAIKLIGSLISKCVPCRRYKGKMMEQKMAELPIQRLQGGEKAFASTGMDYFGPFEIKRGRSTTTKRYGVVFTCYSIRAVHIEMATSLDTSSCINAIRRFVARRGSVSYLRSDNGTNLVGAKKELARSLQEWNQDNMNAQLHQDGIEWEFNCPTASHQGGLWERMIRTIRQVLYGLMKEQTIHLDDEGLQTLFCEAESIVLSTEDQLP